MNQVTPAIRDLARWLLAQEAKAMSESGGTENAATSAYEKLRARWIKVIGVNGYQAILSRALVLARVSIFWSSGSGEAVWLAAAHVNADGILSGGTGIGNGNYRAGGSVEVMAQLLGLMISFVGEDLTLNMVRDVWPEASLGDGNSDEEGAAE